MNKILALSLLVVSFCSAAFGQGYAPGDYLITSDGGANVAVYDSSLAFKHYLDAQVNGATGTCLTSAGQQIAALRGSAKVRSYNSSGAITGEFGVPDVGTVAAGPNSWIVTGNPTGPCGVYTQWGTLVRTLGTGPYNVATVVTGGVVWAGALGSSTVSRFDVFTGTLLGTFSVAPTLSDCIAFHFDVATQSVWIAGDVGTQVGRWDLNGVLQQVYSTGGPFIGGARGISKGASGELLVTAYATGSVHRWTASGTYAGSQVVATHSPSPHGIAWVASTEPSLDWGTKIERPIQRLDGHTEMGSGNAVFAKNCMKVDGSGNVYVTGRSHNGSNWDYATVKYDSSGNELWVRTFNGIRNGDDSALSLVLAPGGGVVVGGSSWGGIAGVDTNFVIIRYATDGAVTWSAELSQGGDEFLQAMTVDGGGNVCATGYRSGVGMVTAKFDAAGQFVWSKVFTGAGGSDSYPTAIGLDSSGNAYVAGHAMGGTSGGATYDIVTIKYRESDGHELWTREFKGSGNGTDNAHDLIVDGSDNVYVTGSTRSVSGNDDYVTFKYDSGGTPGSGWPALYNGTGNGDDQAYALAVDGSGNVYVTGSSTGSTGGYNYATVKYDSSGALASGWPAIYSGMGSNADHARAVALDGSGSVFVTGFTTIGNYDYGTVKYDGSGVQQWAASFSGTGNVQDYAFALAVDGGGNVIVAGRSHNGSNDDYATVKYASGGSTLWRASYHGSQVLNRAGDGGWLGRHCMKVDGSGNVYVTGTSYNGSNYDYATVKYNSSGVQQWAVIYNGTGNSNDYAYALAVDGSGNVYVTGRTYNGSHYDYATVKYNSSGVQQWAIIYNGTGNSDDQAYALAVDGSGNVYVTGRSWSGSHHDYATVKYDSSGVQQWAVIYNGTGNSDDQAYALAVDGSGNVYVTGYSYNGSNNDYATVKYNSSGVQQWAAIYNGTGNSYDYAYALALDGSGNLYVTGSSIGSTGGYNYATVKYNSSGVQQWAAIYNGTGNGDDLAYALAVEGSGDLYVTGFSTGSTGGSNYATVKYNSSGVQQWAAVHDGTGSGEDRAYALAMDGSGNVYVTGLSVGSTGGYNYATLKYNSSGVQQWAAVHDGTGSGEDRAYALAVDGSGNVIVAGYTAMAAGGTAFGTVKYDTGGSQTWARETTFPRSQFEFGSNDWASSHRALKTDAAGNIYLTGRTRNAMHRYDVTTAKYDSAGTQLWLRHWDWADRDDGGYALELDGSGNVYVAGRATSGTNGTDILLLKYDSTGTLLWARTYAAVAGNYDDYATDLVLDSAGNAVLTGTIVTAPGQNDLFVLKYDGSGNIVLVRARTG